MDTPTLHETPAACRTVRVVVLGFSQVERAAMMWSMGKAEGHSVSLCAVDDLGSADVVVADTDDVGVIDAVLSAGRLNDTLFVGTDAPELAMSWMYRPVDPRRVVRGVTALAELDADEIVASRASCFGVLCD